MTLLTRLRRLTAKLSLLLDEQETFNRRQLQEIRDKARKLKKRCRELAELLADMEESATRQALAQDYELAMTLRRKAHDKYRQLKRRRSGNGR
ncbi:MAG: hypothetical protein II007_10445 [Gammaproteobacteria bacterium]|nr:hypothetical protein [Gammaproteobacteria bacterium]